MGDYIITIRRADDLDGPPLLGTSDPDILAAVLSVVTAKLCGRDRQRVRALTFAGEPIPDGSAT
jgi:hypothetical protein